MELDTIELLKLFDSNILEIDISNKNIKGKLNLLKFNNLIKLKCQNNKITCIYNIPNSLEYLDCSNNLIKLIKVTNH